MLNELNFFTEGDKKTKLFTNKTKKEKKTEICESHLKNTQVLCLMIHRQKDIRTCFFWLTVNCKI